MTRLLKLGNGQDAVPVTVVIIPEAAAGFACELAYQLTKSSCLATAKPGREKRPRL